jgi:hypothetical protein
MRVTSNGPLRRRFPRASVSSTQSWCVVEPPALFTSEYVALSYMWALATSSRSTSTRIFQLEAGNISCLACKDALKTDELPDVIVDAIQLCADLGQRYLWVDRLCVVQDDRLAQKTQLQAMDTIYNRATHHRPPWRWQGTRTTWRVDQPSSTRRKLRRQPVAVPRRRRLRLRDAPPHRRCGQQVAIEHVRLDVPGAPALAPPCLRCQQRGVRKLRVREPAWIRERLSV